MDMDETPKLKQRTTFVFATVNKNKDRRKVEDATHATGEKPPSSEDAIAPIDDTRWFEQQYVKYIGFARGKKPDVKEVVKRLFSKKKHVAESDTYTVPVNPKTDAALFTSPTASVMKKCLCGDFECICKGCTLLPPKDLPKEPRQWIDLTDYFHLFKDPNYIKSLNFHITAGSLIPSLKLKVKTEAESAARPMPEGAVDPYQDCPEFCCSRCIAFKMANAETEAKYRYTPEQLETLKKIVNTIKQQKSPSV